MDTNFRYGFYDSIITDNVPDRLYKSDDMASLVTGIISDGVFGSGPFSEDNKHMFVRPMSPSPSNNQVTVDPGLAWFENTWTRIYSTQTVTLPNVPSVTNQKKYYAICLNINSQNRTNSLAVIEGTQSTNPTKPDIGEHDHLLAYVLSDGGQNITSDNIVNEIGMTTPFVTAPLELTHIDSYFNGFTEQFNRWFDTLRNESPVTQDGAKILDKIRQETVNRIYGTISKSQISSGYISINGIPGKCEELRLYVKQNRTTEDADDRLLTCYSGFEFVISDSNIITSKRATQITLGRIGYNNYNSWTAKYDAQYIPQSSYASATTNFIIYMDVTGQSYQNAIIVYEAICRNTNYINPI